MTFHTTLSPSELIGEVPWSDFRPDVLVALIGTVDQLDAALFGFTERVGRQGHFRARARGEALFSARDGAQRRGFAADGSDRSP